MQDKKLVMIGLVVMMMIFDSFLPVSKIVLADDTDTVDIIFKITGNITIVVSPSSYNFSTIYANSSESTSNTEFTIWNNGTVDNLTIDIRITTSPSNPVLTCSESGPPTETDSYALLGLKGTIEKTPWYKESDWENLDTDLVKGHPETFGLKLYAGNISSMNTSWETLTITYRASV